MKKSILAVSLLAISASSWAADDYFIDKIKMTTPELIVKVGSSFDDDKQEGAGNVNAVTITLQDKQCYRGVLCYNPSLMWLFGKERTVDGDLEINIGAGLDAKKKFPRGLNNGFYLEAGVWGFIEPLHNEDATRMNFHVGAGMEINHVIVSVDAYVPPNDGRPVSPLFLLNAGYRF